MEEGLTIMGDFEVFIRNVFHSFPEALCLREYSLQSHKNLYHCQFKPISEKINSHNSLPQSLSKGKVDGNKSRLISFTKHLAFWEARYTLPYIHPICSYTSKNLLGRNTHTENLLVYPKRPSCIGVLLGSDV